MSDMQLTWDPNIFQGDVIIAMGDLATKNELETAVLVSLFTWRRAQPDDPLPYDGSPLQGWWGDSFADVEQDQIGSKLWLLSREKLTQETMNRAREYIREALQWMLDDGVATQVDVSLEKRDAWTLAILVTIYRRSGQIVPLRFEHQWEALANA